MTETQDSYGHGAQEMSLYRGSNLFDGTDGDGGMSTKPKNTFFPKRMDVGTTWTIHSEWKKVLSAMNATGLHMEGQTYLTQEALISCVLTWLAEQVHKRGGAELLADELRPTMARMGKVVLREKAEREAEGERLPSPKEGVTRPKSGQAKKSRRSQNN